VAVNNAAQLDQAQSRLIASEAVAGMGAIAGTLAHNLKNYVTGIRQIARELVTTADPETEELMGEIIEATDLALAEVNSFTQPLTGWEATDVELDTTLLELARQVAKSLKGRQNTLLQKARIAVECQPFGHKVFVHAGKEQLHWIFRNLIDNAIRAIDEKGEPEGKITLRISRIESISETEWVTVQVEDTGKGIPRENIERIFDRSFTTRPEGTVGGYGLFWVRLNVGRIGGKIAASSEPGVGTTFDVRLPLVKTE
jgi:two-component system, NtrC family, sensor kinase